MSWNPMRMDYLDMASKEALNEMNWSETEREPLTMQNWYSILRGIVVIATAIVLAFAVGEISNERLPIKLILSILLGGFIFLVPSSEK